MATIILYLNFPSSEQYKSVSMFQASVQFRLAFALNIKILLFFSCNLLCYSHWPLLSSADALTCLIDGAMALTAKTTTTSNPNKFSPRFQINFQLVLNLAEVDFQKPL